MMLTSVDLLFHSDSLLSMLEQHCGRLTEEDFFKLGPEVVAELHELLSMISRVV